MTGLQEEFTERGETTTLLIATAKDREVRRGATPKSDNPTLSAMSELLASEDGKALYARRGSIIEPPFGNAKANRGFTRLVCAHAMPNGPWSAASTTC